MHSLAEYPSSPPPRKGFRVSGAVLEMVPGNVNEASMTLIKGDVRQRQPPLAGTCYSYMLHVLTRVETKRDAAVDNR